MRPFSPLQEQRLIDALVSLDWMTHDRTSCKIICEQLGCSMKEAMEVLQHVYRHRKLIRPTHRGNENLTRGVVVPRYAWKWERQR
jgi:hypothetical protein